jgi:superfamily I DNA/RNA helicase
MAHEVWQRMLTDRTFPLVHDAYLKWAQVRGALDLSEITAVLVDEAQDFTNCQWDAFVRQLQRTTAVFLVGDMAQALYSWRSAKPAQLASLSQPKSNAGWPHTLRERLDSQGRTVIVTTLTQTFRFGRAIAAVANSVLFVKEHSEQSKLWVPYRVRPRPGSAGEVTNGPVEYRRGQQVVVIGRTNLSLARKAWELLEADPKLEIAILGDGESAGRNKFAAVFREVKAALDLYRGQRSKLLKRSKFEEFKNWDDFKGQVEERELNTFSMHISLVEEFGGDPRSPAEPRLLGLIRRFQELILDRKYDKSKADVLLSTVCQAKGLEWPHVEVLDDCIMLDVLTTRDAGNVVFKLQDDRKGDEINSWFVACTRAQHTLCLPPRWWTTVDLARNRGPLTQAHQQWWDALTPDQAKEAHALLDGLCNSMGGASGSSGSGGARGSCGGGEGRADDDDNSEERAAQGGENPDRSQAPGLDLPAPLKRQLPQPQPERTGKKQQTR